MQSVLDPSERARLKSQHKYERDGQVSDRIKAILLYEKGWSYRMIAEALFITHEAARQHTLDYEAVHKLSPENGESSSKLNAARAKLLLEQLQKHIYLYAKDIVVYGWIQKGQRKEIPTNRGRQRVNLSGMIDIISKQVLIREDEILEAESIIRFLRRIEAAYPSKQTVHFFCDNARYYRNKKVEVFLETSKILMHFLPPYSPNLIPIERLWKLTNEWVLNNKCYKNFSEFRNSLLSFLGSLSDPRKDLLKILKYRITDSFRAVGSILTVNSST